jgi:hypothetical protein
LTESELSIANSSKKISDLQNELELQEKNLEKERKQKLLKQRTNNVLSDKISELEILIKSLKEQGIQRKKRSMEVDQKLAQESEMRFLLESRVQKLENQNKT